MEERKPQRLVVTVGEKVIPRKVRKQVKDPMKYSGTTRKTSQTNRIKPDRNYIEIPAEKASSAKSILSSKLVVTFAQIKYICNNKTLEN